MLTMDSVKLCPCGTGTLYADCCKPLLEDAVLAVTSEQLMRSRYTAYVLCRPQYILQTTHPKKRHQYSQKDIEHWSKENNWLGLEVLKAEGITVMFKAYYLDALQKRRVHYEKSTFEFYKGKWYYVEGEFNE